jgi:hypothetical protein
MLFGTRAAIVQNRDRRSYFTEDELRTIGLSVRATGDVEPEPEIGVREAKPERPHFRRRAD